MKHIYIFQFHPLRSIFVLKLHKNVFDINSDDYNPTIHLGSHNIMMLALSFLVFFLALKLGLSESIALALINVQILKLNDAKDKIYSPSILFSVLLMMLFGVIYALIVHFYSLPLFLAIIACCYAARYAMYKKSQSLQAIA